ncbi:MAG: Holliday junction resolvase RuvX [Alphaproteobacteria bacterium]|nr:Holliday junction resolvase RuvX [Alphaproteobacteria bacterium]
MSETQDILLRIFLKKIKPGRPLIGIDYGSVRIGVAVSDAAQAVAAPFKTIARISELDDIVGSRNAGGFVIGLPLQTDGAEGETARAARLFGDRIAEKFGLPVYWADERHSSVQTDEALKASHMRADKRRKVLDPHVAARLLQRVLDLKNTPTSSGRPAR